MCEEESSQLPTSWRRQRTDPGADELRRWPSESGGARGKPGALGVLEACFLCRHHMSPLESSLLGAGELLCLWASRGSKPLPLSLSVFSGALWRVPGFPWNLV